ncbi:TPA: PadR family transcriptional regulator, partial [Listeria monocytogenes]|nr:PadR family transcriptional regulator [Listeria monocytogenes]HEL8826377.1 PadR family transcriptional regulator [Listeria monocytogenes]
MEVNPQFKKGVLELCCLFLIQKKDCYGYELANQVS